MIDITAVRTDAVLVTADVSATVTAPRLYFTLKMNPVYDSSLRLPVGSFTCDSEGPVVLAGEVTNITGNIMTGYVQGDVAVANGIPSDTRWMFDLPDENFLYPGDVLHYYMEAWDDLNGDYQNATMPGDLTGYGVFDGGPLAYNTSFVVHALPSVTDASGTQPGILFWNDFANRGGPGRVARGLREPRLPGRRRLRHLLHQRSVLWCQQRSRWSRGSGSAVRVRHDGLHFG